MKFFTLLFCNIFVLTAAASTHFFYYPKDLRVKTLEDMYESVKETYALWDLKLINMEISGDQLFQEAILYEKSLIDAQGPIAQAKSNIEFHDRVQKLIASFKDTHFGSKFNTRLPNVLNGIRTRPVINKGNLEVIVTGISKKIKAHNNEMGSSNQFDNISLYDKVIKIDGVPVTDMINQIKDYVDASSEKFRTYSAVEFLSRRYFMFPKKNFSDWTFEKIEDGKPVTYKVRLPWYVDKTDRNDAKVYFGANQFRILDDLHYAWNEKTQKFDYKANLVYEGHHYTDAPKDIKDSEEWYSETELDSENPLPDFRTGFFEKNKKKYGYFQFFAFSNVKLYQKEDTEKAKGELLTELIYKFINKLKAQNIPLIVDLRRNYGGSTSIAIRILSALAKANESYPSRTVTYKLTPYMLSLMSNDPTDPSLDEEVFYLPNWDFLVDEVFYAHSLGRKYSNVLLYTDPIKAHPKVNGFEQPVVMLVSPWCISACDNQAFLFKASNRVKLIGEHANGTGAGFFSNKYHSSTYIDQNNIFNFRIPNYLFGYPIVSEERSIEDPDLSLLINNNSENKPVAPHITFPMTTNSYQSRGSDWIDKAISILNKN